jgi:1-acyl-sn-glycerol-3-phosphate acyltransferase
MVRNDQGPAGSVAHADGRTPSRSSQPPPRGPGRALYVAYGAVVVTAVLITLWLVTVFVRRPRRAVALQCAASRIILAFLGCRFTVRGEWPARDAAARVFVANHTSYLDIPLMLAALNRDFAFVTKRELLDWPIISRITRAGGHIPVDRDSVESRGAVVARIVKTLRAGRSVLMFPEGTFSHDDGLRSFHAGAFKGAIAAGVPVVPVALNGVARVWSQHARFPRSGVVEIWVGEALEVAAWGGGGGGDEAQQMDGLREAAVRFIAGHAGYLR